MSERTHDQPGDCIKCGSAKNWIRWEDHDVTAPGGEYTQIGQLFVTCIECRFKWQVKAKDEEPKT